MPTDLYTSLDNLSERRIGIMVAMIPSQRWSTLVIWRIRIMGKYLHNIPQILVATRLSSSRGWSLVSLHIGRRYNASQNWRHIAKGRGDNGDVAASPHCQWPTIMAEHLCNWLHSRRQKEFKVMMIKRLCILIIAPPPPPPSPPRSLLQKDFTAQCQVCKWSTWD